MTANSPKMTIETAWKTLSSQCIGSACPGCPTPFEIEGAKKYIQAWEEQEAKHKSLVDEVMKEAEKLAEGLREWKRVGMENPNAVYYIDGKLSHWEAFKRER